VTAFMTHNKRSAQRPSDAHVAFATAARARRTEAIPPSATTLPISAVAITLSIFAAARAATPSITFIQPFPSRLRTRQPAQPRLFVALFARRYFAIFALHFLLPFDSDPFMPYYYSSPDARGC